MRDRRIPLRGWLMPDEIRIPEERSEEPGGRSGPGDVEVFARCLADEVRRISRSTPTPQTHPFFGLDHPAGCGSRLLDRLSDLGIFRFYERVLDLDHGIGGPARWLARRKGCSVVSVNGSAAAARASRYLVERAGLEPQVEIIRASSERLPLADCAMTHAWSVEALLGVGDLATVLREVHRVLRPGGQLAIQEWGEPGSDPAIVAPATLRLLLAQVGFLEIRVGVVTSLADPRSAHAELLEARLGGRVPWMSPPGDERYQIFARKRG